MAMILGWFLYLSIALKIGRGIFSARGSEPLISGILRFLAALEKKNFEVVHYPYPHLLFCYPLLVLFSHLILICQKVMV